MQSLHDSDWQQRSSLYTHIEKPKAIGIIELQSYFTRSIANSVKKDKARTALRPVDLLFFTVSLRQLETSMVKIERSGRNLCAFAYDAWKNAG